MVDGGFGARLPLPRAQAGQRHGQIARQGAEDILVDASFGEAVHAMYSKVARASGSSKFAFRAAGARLVQNFSSRAWSPAP